MKTDENVKSGRLARRPEAVGYSVERIVLDAMDGIIRIPDFQRPLRWKAKDVIDFYDSIRRGFPVGELLLSRRYAGASTVSFGSIHLETVESTSALWVVDGQQRITSLVATLKREEETPRGDSWAIWYDLQSLEFHRLSKSDAPPTWIPLNVVLDSKKLLKWIRQWPFADRDDLVDEALELGKAIREYQMPAYIVDGADEAALRLIFTRSNNSGAPMRDSEVFDALYQSEGTSPIKSAISRLTDTGFGEIDEDVFLRCIRLVNGVDEGVSLEKLSESLTSDAVISTENAIRRTINALMSAGIPHMKLLPYRLGLLVLVKLFSRFPGESEPVDRLASNWLWRGILTAELEHSSRANVRRAVNSINAACSAEEACLKLINNLPEVLSIDSPSVKRDPRAEFGRSVSTQRAAVKVLILLMYDFADQHRDLWQDEFVGRYELFGETIMLDFDHPYESLSGPGGLVEDIVIQLHDVPPCDFAWKHPHLCFLDDVCLENLRKRMLKEFRERRRNLLSVFIVEAINQRIGNLAELRPTIPTIVATAGMEKTK